MRGQWGDFLSGLTTHVLDTTHGKPAAGVVVRLFRGAEQLLSTRTNADGRCDAPLLSSEPPPPRRSRVHYAGPDYYGAARPPRPPPPFLETVTLDFGIADTAAHYHVPLLVSPYGYSTYRGS